MSDGPDAAREAVARWLAEFRQRGDGYGYWKAADELLTIIGTIPCPNCNPAIERSA